MKINVDQPIIDMLTGKQGDFAGQPATIKSVIIYCGQMPAGQSGAPEPPEEAARAFDLAVRASTARNGSMTLDLNEASFLKTRAYRMCFPLYAGALDKVLEAAAETPEAPPPSGG